MTRKKMLRWIVVVVALAVIAFVARRPAYDVYRWKAHQGLRDKLFAALRPVQLTNCTLKRFGHAHDGGYLMCENLLGDAKVVYSYGIDARDDWGCDVSRATHLLVHQYDCFNLNRPVCEGGDFVFHEECVGPQAARIDGRAYDSVTNHLARNGDMSKHLVMKMDVESAEWDSLAATDERDLDNIDQLAIELHGLDDEKNLAVVEKLKKTFHVANVHFNNYACMWWTPPFPGLAIEVLFVNKRLGVVDTARPWGVHPNPLDTPNNPDKKDCQAEQWR